ncbi:MAG: putative transrane protein [Sphingobacteriales bacterium]|nr:putative transrane protein [Sphingobacteriales bacterium]
MLEMIKKLALYIITGILVTVSSSFEMYQTSEKEYLLKAAFLYRFADYIDWKSEESEEVFNIAILGESIILNPLMQISNDKRIRNKKIRVKQYSNIDDIEPCQMIFVSMSYKHPLEPLITKFSPQSTLIVSERIEDFNQGSHINFLISENKLKFEVNLKTASDSGLKISSQLLQHAMVVKQ